MPPNMWNIKNLHRVPEVSITSTSFLALLGQYSFFPVVDMQSYSFHQALISALHAVIRFPAVPNTSESLFASCPLPSGLSPIYPHKASRELEPGLWGVLTSESLIPIAKHLSQGPHVILCSFFSACPWSTLWFHMLSSWNGSQPFPVSFVLQKPSPNWKFSLPLVSRTVQLSFVFPPSSPNASFPCLSGLYF